MARALSGRAKIALPLGILLLVGLSWYRLCHAPFPGPYLEFAGPTMGTTYMVKVASGELDAAAQREIAAAIEAQLARVNALMSNWDPSSEISRFNAHATTAPFPIATETLEVLRIAQEVSRQSGGAFDVTVAPLVRAWGFGVDAATTPPADDALAALRERVDYRELRLDAERSTVAKARPNVEVDLSAVAKGYGVDRVAEALAALGHRDFLVEIGGELRGRGTRLDGEPWHVAIERPVEGRRQLHTIVPLRDLAIATSGDYRNYREVDGERLSHTIDPRTGRPIRHGLASVSVLHPSAATADALATALNVLGPEKGYALAERMSLPALFIVRSARSDSTGSEPETRGETRQEAGFESRATPPFERLTAAAESPPTP